MIILPYLMELINWDMDKREDSYIAVVGASLFALGKTNLGNGCHMHPPHHALSSIRVVETFRGRKIGFCFMYVEEEDL